jgi:hypothetical protein
MNKTLFVATSICILLIHSTAISQTEEPPRYEIAAEFSALGRSQNGCKRLEPAVGARFTFNINKNFAIEGATHGSFSGECPNCLDRGRVFDLVGGLKAGKRFEKWGLFAKVRPGVVNYTFGEINVVPSGTGGSFPFRVEAKGTDNFATDLGGVVEFYPSRRIVTRFDLGDMIIHTARRTGTGVNFDPATQTYFLVPFTTPARTTHNFQFIASVGFRF